MNTKYSPKISKTIETPTGAVSILGTRVSIQDFLYTEITPTSELIYGRIDKPEHIYSGNVLCITTADRKNSFIARVQEITPKLDRKYIKIGLQLQDCTRLTLYYTTSGINQHFIPEQSQTKIVSDDVTINGVCDLKLAYLFDISPEEIIPQIM
jgi:hypothetical protein